jgi:hypothetical protein
VASKRKKTKAEISDELRVYLRKLGAKGGTAAAASLTPEERSQRARHAVAAREAKRKGGAQ